MVTRSFVSSGRVPVFYQEEFGPAVLAACGLGFRNPADAASLPQLSALRAFLAQQTPTFDCTSLPQELAAAPFDLFQVVHRYLLGVAALVWRVSGVSWPSLAWLGGLFAGLSGAAAYLFFRTAMGTVLALLLTTLWITAPLHLEHVPHLRDYAKTPFFAVLLCAAMWAARATAPRAATVSVMAALGAFFGIGLGIRTDVAVYLPIVIAVLMFRWPLTRNQLVTRCLAAAAAVVMFTLFAAPVLRGYQKGNNLAHVALLGLTDASREWLQLQPAPYSYGYLYNDSYVAHVIAAEAERRQPRATPLSLGSGEYAAAGNELYGRLLRMFPGDTLTRSWAAVRGSLRLPFVPVQLQRPMWLTGLGGRLLDWRGAIVKRIAIVPPLAAAVVAIAMLGAADFRLAIIVGSLFALLAGSTAVQFQGRHIFQLELFSWCVLGFVAATIWRLGRGAFPLAAYPRLITRAAIVTVMLMVVVVAPIAAARGYQSRQVSQLFSAYAEAPTEPVETLADTAADESQVLLRVVPPQRRDRRFIDSDVLIASFGGGECDADAIDVTFRYAPTPLQADLTRHRLLPMPPPGPQRTRIVFPTFSTGELAAESAGLKFAGLELARADRSCLADLRRVSKPESLPIVLEMLLTSDWRSHPLYEAFQGLEPRSEDWHFETYSLPAGLKPGRRWLASLEPIHAAPAFRSRQVRDIDASRIESAGREERHGAYLLTWPYETKPAGAAFYVEGELFDGGLSIGFQENDTWVKQLNVDAAGKFRAVLRVDAPGSYGAVLANHQIGSGGHHSVITRYGWLPPQQ